MEVIAGRVAAPGRVVLIGEHIDYHNLSVLPMALERRVVVEWRARNDSRIRATSRNGFPAREFDWTDDLRPAPAGDWENYIRAAAHTVHLRWGRGVGIDAEVNADLAARRRAVVVLRAAGGLHAGIAARQRERREL